VSFLHRPLRSHSRSELVRAEKMAEFDVGDERHEIHRFGLKEIDYKPHLSFFRIDKSYVADRTTAYKEHVATFGARRPFFRNEALFAAHCRNKEELSKIRIGIQ
jgi:hypothetical protein